MKNYTKSKVDFPVKKLLTWYYKNKRDFPWRRTQDPYKIWISEVMLQQTTSSAVVAYYEKFLKLFPNLKSLALAEEKNVLQAWAGLGYYSRASNLHKSAIQMHANKKFPQTYEQLLKLPGFGNYTARSVSSFAFNQSVGVLDTNVIRFVCRYNNLSLEWWKTKPRQHLQKLVDDYSQHAVDLKNYSDHAVGLKNSFHAMGLKNSAHPVNLKNHSDKKQKNKLLINSAQLNQALIEIGANICSPKAPQCIICPLRQTCQAFKKQTYFKLPLKKTKTSMQQIYALKMQLLINEKKEIALDILEKKLFLKNIPLPPSKITKLNKAPKKYDFVHYITHYKIFVSVKTTITNTKGSYLWVKPQQISLHSPTSLLKKAIKLMSNNVFTQKL